MEEENNWGSKKSEYYERNKTSKQADNYIEEEEEAIKIQKSKLKKYKELNLLDSDDEEEQQPGLNTKVVKYEKYNLESSSDSDKEEEKISINKKAIIIPKEDKEEQKQIFKNILKHINEIEENVNPIIEILKNEIKDSTIYLKDTNEYLERKRKLHLIYPIYMIFYSYYKSNNKINDHHPVIKKMLFIKSLLDDMKETDVNLFKEIDKILKLIEAKKIEEEEDNKSDDINEFKEEDGIDEENLYGEFDKLPISSNKEISYDFLNKKRSITPKTANSIPISSSDTKDFIKQNQERINELKNEKIGNELKKKKKLIKDIEYKNEMGQRLANDQILKARGIVRKRKKYQGNAKLHLREKYFKKQKERKNFVKFYEGKPEVYSGEVTGIRRDLVRSTKFK